MKRSPWKLASRNVTDPSQLSDSW